MVDDYSALSGFLWRAPLLPARDLARAAERLKGHRWGREALVGASASLGEALESEAGARALSRYARRAAYRPTPQGLWAGVGVGVLGEELAVDTGAPTRTRVLRWQDVRSHARALLERDDVRATVRLRRAPSLLQGPTHVVWLALGLDERSEERSLAPTGWLVRLLEATEAWRPWPEVRAALAGRDVDELLDGASPDDLLLSLVDDGLLHVDLSPPLVGPPAAAWLAAHGRTHGLEGLEMDPDGAPAVLRFDGDVVLPRALVTRAAALVPLLTRLQSALGEPAAERSDLGGLQRAVETLAAVHGEGRVPLGPLATGSYGVVPEEPVAPASPEGTARLFAWLGAAVGAAVARGEETLVLDADTLDVLLPPAPRPLTAELFLSPASPAEEGLHGLLGLHGPAGASWGRFLHHLPEAAAARLAPTLAALTEAETAAAPGEESVDVAYAASAALGDLGHHPPLRRRCLALSAWPAPDTIAVTPAELGLVVEEGLDGTGAAALSDGEGRLLSPRPWHRVRAHTAPLGVYRLLAGWTLQRQHAPWAAPMGPMAEWPTLPRLVVEGFVIAPRTWRVPPEEGLELRAWRRQLGVPRWVQVGSGDELLPVDLDDPEAARDLRGHDHVFELWPAPRDLPDRRGRRVEAVIAVVAPAAVKQDPRPARWAQREDIGGAAPGWSTLKIFGAPDHQDAILVDVLGPLLRARAETSAKGAWFFQRFVEGPGTRHHLRVRLAGRGADTWMRRLAIALAPAYAAGAVTSHELGPYVPERGRFGAAALPWVHALFQAQSDAVLGVLAHAPLTSPEERIVLLVRLFDAFCHGVGLAPDAREIWARTRFEAEAAASPLPSDDRLALDRLFRQLRPALREHLADGKDARREPLRPTLRRLSREVSEVRALAAGLDQEALIAPLLHLFAVRLLGPDRDSERATYLLWARTREGLRKAPLTEAATPATSAPRSRPRKATPRR